jgi:tRNA pseudouridine55 synthase
MNEAGYLLLNKKPGLTSFETLAPVKKAFSTGKVGHTGTLDKFAAGLLLALTGRAVKLTPWFSGGDKRYEGIIRCGVETDTLDPEGVPVAEGPAPALEALTRALSGFRGNILQAPPVYSAVHIRGKRASELARSGQTIEMPARPVTIYALELRAYRPPDAVIFVHCSKGAYIRSLARDIARAAGSCGHLAGLTRTRIAGFRVSDAVDPSEASPAALKPLDRQAFETLGMFCAPVSDDAAWDVIRGKPITEILSDLTLPAAITAAGLFRKNGELLAVLEQNGGHWRYGYVYARP